ncbi:MAG: hypothetical protein ACR2NU_00805, partial [Aeoliella sp.]
MTNAISSVLTRLLTISVFAWAIRHLIHRVPEEELAILPVVLSITLFFPILQNVFTAGLSRFVTEA